MQKSQGWIKNNRKVAYDSPFLKVYEDEVILPNGKSIPDYTVVEKPSITVIVATDDKNRVLLVNEYKYAANQFLWGLPAGHVKEREMPIEVAKRELLEETGMSVNLVTEKGILKEYPTKDLHIVYVVKAEGVKPEGKTNHEETETIDKMRFFTKEEILDQIHQGNILSSTTISGLVLAGVLC